MSFAELHHFDGKKSREMLIDMSACCFRPAWSDPTIVGFLVSYIDMNDSRSTVEQMVDGYRMSAGCEPFGWPVEQWTIEEDGGLKSVRHGDVFRPLSRIVTELPDGASVVFFEAAMTAVLKDGDLVAVWRMD